MADTLTFAYAADITKAERDENGDLLVYGKAAGPDLDADEQICDPEWLKTAMPGWAEWSNVREMHQPICAGVGLVTEEQGDDWLVQSKCIDPVTAKKIDAGALRGYSVGIKNPRVVKDARAPGGRIVGGSIVEISYVDRPCNPTATMAICKAIGTGGALGPVEAATDAELTISVGERRFTPLDLAKLLTKGTEPDADQPSGGEHPVDEPPAAEESADAPAGGEQPARDQTPDEQPTEPVEDAETEPAPHADEPADQPKGVALGRDDLTKALIQALEAHTAKGAMPPIKPGGPQRYPVTDVASLKDAIEAFGRGKDTDKDTIKTHIKAEAKRLGRSDLIPDKWKALLVKDAAALDATGGDTGMRHDPDELRSILQGLVDCMKAELDELVAGEDELWDLRQLLETVSAFCCWWCSEAYDGETESPYTGSKELLMAATADTTTVQATIGKTTEPDTTSPEPTGPDTDTETRLTDLVKSVVADATKAITAAAEERNTTLTAELETVKADLAKALALPEPGGPVITRTATQEATARRTDALQLHAQASELLAKAATATDPYLAQGYRERAAALSAKAAV